MKIRGSWLVGVAGVLVFGGGASAQIARLGAKQDGVLRNHQRSSDGSYRDTVVFSIIESEWLAVKQHLRFKLEERVGS